MWYGNNKYTQKKLTEIELNVIKLVQFCDRQTNRHTDRHTAMFKELLPQLKNEIMNTYID